MTLAICDVPEQSIPGTAQLKVHVDKDEGVSSTNSLDVKFVEGASISSASPLFMYFVDSEEAEGTFFGSGLLNGIGAKVYLLAGGILFELEATTDSTITFLFPKLDSGQSFQDVYVSTNQNDFLKSELSVPIEIRACPAGHICSLSTSAQCSLGEFCPPA